MHTLKPWLWALCLCTLAYAQDPAILRVRAASQNLKQSLISRQPGSSSRLRLEEFQRATRDWTEAQLAQAPIPWNPRALQQQWQAALTRIGVFGHDDHVGDEGRITRLDLVVAPHDPSHLAIIVGSRFDSPCGTVDAVTMYSSDAGKVVRVFQDNPDPDDAQQVTDLQWSSPDPTGARVLLTLRTRTHCASNWNELTYSAFRVYPHRLTTEPVLHRRFENLNLGGDPPHARAEPNGFLIELTGRSLDLSEQTRRHVIHLQLTNTGATRLDPVALRPQDFVEEWLARRWTEMASRSVEPEKLERWHKLASDPDMTGSFTIVQRCSTPGLWQLELTIDKGKLGTAPLWFLVQSRPGYHFLMKSVSVDRQPGCPGDTEAPTDQPPPTLFPEAKVP